MHNYGEALSAGSSVLLEKEEVTGEELAALVSKNPPLQTDEEVMLLTVCDQKQF